MVDTVTATYIENGNRNFVARFTNFSDGTGEAAVVKIDATSTGPLGVNIRGQMFYPGIHIKIRRIIYDVKGMALRLLWAAGTPVDIVTLSGFSTMKFDKFAGLTVPSGLVGATGNILFTTAGQMPNSAYTVIIHGTKGVPAS